MLPKYPIPAGDPQGLYNLNRNFKYLEDKTDSIRALPIVVYSEGEMLALDAAVGSIAMRMDITDQSNQFMLGELPASNLANWIQQPLPISAVMSVNGQVGNVLLTPNDIKDPGTGLPILDPLSGAVPIKLGGTDANTAEDARANLGLETTRGFWEPYVDFGDTPGISIVHRQGDWQRVGPNISMSGFICFQRTGTANFGNQVIIRGWPFSIPIRASTTFIRSFTTPQAWPISGPATWRWAITIRGQTELTGQTWTWVNNQVWLEFIMQGIAL